MTMSIGSSRVVLPLLVIVMTVAIGSDSESVAVKVTSELRVTVV